MLHEACLPLGLKAWIFYREDMGTDGKRIGALCMKQLKPEAQTKVNPQHEAYCKAACHESGSFLPSFVQTHETPLMQ